MHTAYLNAGMTQLALGNATALAELWGKYVTMTYVPVCWRVRARARTLVPCPIPLLALSCPVAARLYTRTGPALVHAHAHERACACARARNPVSFRWGGTQCGEESAA